MPIQKDIDPRGLLLNDNDTGVDHLSMSTFADAIAESLHHVETPITVGLYGKWGSGKSFRLRQIENILDRFQKQQQINEKRAEKYKRKTDHRKLRCKHACRAVLWAVCIVLVFVMLLATFMLAVKPSLLTDCFGLNLTEPDDAESEEVTDKPDNEIDKSVSVLTVLKIVGLILLPIELLMVFVIGCFGSNWLSHDHYGSCKLLTYGAFTKLPLRTSANAIVEDPGDSPAKVLKYVKRGDERLAIAVADAPVYPRKYIFVNFKAWEYAGSDTLWAAIVTKMTDAIEEEFGTITARLFRMLKIEKINKNICRNDARTIYVELMETSKEDDVMDMMQQYGVVECCQKLPNSHIHWQVEYSSDIECRNAKECLKIENVPFTVKNPMLDIAEEETTDGPISRVQPCRESRRELIEMRDFGRRRPTNPDCDDIDLDRWRSPTNEPCCNRFCCHFVRHPIKILCLPRLIWWILILACAVLTPLIAYIEAEYFQLDIYRTYRSIPLYGQILLWLPAATAVSALVIRFVWAMCHSQRKRINAALDGTKKNMAEQLGFMSKVKSEIEVVTKLIHCARFTHQKDYKIVITIDDLDRIEMRKIQSVLEALNVLLSDVSAPFICLVAVDSRVAVKCIEENMGDVLKESRITGQEYLKKIINLPICLPEINDSSKKRFIAGLIDQADRAVTYRIENERSRMKPRQDLKKNSPIWQGRQSQFSPISEEIVSPDGSDETLAVGIPREDDIDAAGISTDDERDEFIKKAPAKDKNGNIPTAITVDSAASTSKHCKESLPVRNHQHDNGEVASLKTTKSSTKAIVHAENAPQTTDVNGNISRPLPSYTAMPTTTAGQEVQTDGDVTRHKTSGIRGTCGNEMPVSEEQTDGNFWSRRTGIEENNNQPCAPACERELELGHEKFLFECRRHIYDDADLHKHIHGNPRNIKRIFNVVSLTASLINSSLKKKQRRNFIHSHCKENENHETDSPDPTKRTGSLAADIVRWVILTDQWPYRTSYILQVIEDASQRYNAGLLDERIPDYWTILEIWEYKVKEECLKGEAWLSLDGDPDLFFSFLRILHKEGFKTQKILNLQNYIVNLDHSIRHAISFERDISALKLNPQINSPTRRSSTPSDVSNSSLQNDVPAPYEECSSPLRKNGPLSRPCTWPDYNLLDETEGPRQK